MQRGGRGDLKETVGLEEEREGGHEGVAVPSGDVHRVGRAPDEAIAVSYECSQAIALRLGDLVICLHADGQPDMRRPAGVKAKQCYQDEIFTEPKAGERTSERTPTCGCK